MTVVAVCTDTDVVSVTSPPGDVEGWLSDGDDPHARAVLRTEGGTLQIIDAPPGTFRRGGRYRITVEEIRP